MFDMEDFFGMGFEEEPELSNDLVQGGCESEGVGWGSFLLGGAIGCIMGAGNRGNSERGSCQPAVFESFSSESETSADTPARIFTRESFAFSL